MARGGVEIRKIHVESEHPIDCVRYFLLFGFVEPIGFNVDAIFLIPQFEFEHAGIGETQSVAKRLRAFIIRERRKLTPAMRVDDGHEVKGFAGSKIECGHVVKVVSLRQKERIRKKFNTNAVMSMAGMMMIGNNQRSVHLLI